MKKYRYPITFILLFFGIIGYSQTSTDAKGVEAACLDYLEGFYEGDTTKLIRSIQPTLTKFGYYKDRGAEDYAKAGYMSFEEAKAFARNVAEKKRFPKADAPKEVEVLDIMNQIASAKVTAWWGTDYILLSKKKDKWMIEQVLWEGPLIKQEK